MKRSSDIYNLYSSKGLDLSSLPPDIQQYILSQDPNLIRIGRQLNTNMRSRLSDAYFDKICNVPIKNSEIVANRSAIRVLYDNHVEGEDRDISNFEFVIDWNEGDSNSISFFKDLNLNLYIFNIYLNSTIQFKSYTRIKTAESLNEYIDLISIWIILAKRRDCVTLDPDYPRKQTIALFQRFVVRFKTSNIKDLLFLFSYLITHIWLFKAEYRGPNNFIIAVDDNDQPLPDQDTAFQLALKRYPSYIHTNKVIIPNVYNYLLATIDEITTFVINVLNTVEFDYTNFTYSYKINI